MNRLTLNSVSNSAFRVNATSGGVERDDIVAEGRVLFYERARKGQEAMYKVLGIREATAEALLNGNEYKDLNETFRREHLMYAAKLCCAQTGEKAPADYDEFRRRSQAFYGNAAFYKVLQSIYTEIVTPILPAVYSEAVGVFADVVEVGFGETYQLTIGSNDIPVFQDSSWGASRSVPRNRFYPKDYTLNPQPKSCWITAKWHQLVANNIDFGEFFANIVAGMYAKTMGMWNAAMQAAAVDTTKVPSGLTYTFSTPNWVSAANKVSAVNNTAIGNLIAVGGLLPLSKVLPTTATGSSNTAMDAALATLLGSEYNARAYLGEFMGVRLMPLTDAVVPGTQNGDVSTILSGTQIWMMASNRRKPMTIAYNRDTPIQIEMDPTRSADFEIGINLTIALDSVATFASRVALLTIS